MMVNELKFLLRNVKENIRKLTSEKHLIQFLESYKENTYLNKLNDMVTNELDCSSIGRH